MSDLSETMKIVLAETFSFYMKAHYFHWNVEGPLFKVLHELFRDIYEEVWAAVDTIAEHLRTLDVYAPCSYSRFKQLSTIVEEVNIPHPMDMVRQLESDNKTVIASLHKAMLAAEQENKVGIVNFLQVS